MGDSSVQMVIVRVDNEARSGVAFALTKAKQKCYIPHDLVKRLYDEAHLDGTGSVVGLLFSVNLASNPKKEMRDATPYVVTDVIKMVGGFETAAAPAAKQTTAQPAAKPRSPLALTIDKYITAAADAMPHPDRDELAAIAIMDRRLSTSDPQFGAKLDTLVAEARHAQIVAATNAVHKAIAELGDEIHTMAMVNLAETAHGSAALELDSDGEDETEAATGEAEAEAASEAA